MGKRRRARNAKYLKKRSTTDPDATLFYRPGAGNCLSYKAHLATDINGFVTAINASSSSLHDSGAVPVLIQAHEKMLGTPEWICADKKYGSEECLKFLQDKKIKTVINPDTKSNRPGYFSKDNFKFDSKNDVYICPDKKILKRKAKSATLNRIIYAARKQDCLFCKLRNLCIKPDVAGPRKVTHYDSNYYSKVRKYFHSDYGKVMQGLRSTIIEGVIGRAKTYHLIDRTRFRGITKVEIQFYLTATAINLKKIVKTLGVNELKSEIFIVIREYIALRDKFLIKFSKINNILMA